MTLRVFEAASRNEAMAAITAALGPDALIVSAKETDRGFRLTAAMPEEEADLALLLAPEPLRRPDPVLRWVIDFHRPASGVVERLNSEPAHAPDGQDDVLSQRLAGFVRFEPLRWARPKIAPPRPSAAEHAGLRPLALVGLPGSGKTACAARLALAARLAGQVPQVTSLDRVKTGGQTQLRELLAAMDLVLQPELQGLADGQPALVDTAGVNPYSVKDMAGLARRLDELDAEPLLVFDAACDAADALDTATAFHAIGVRRAIVTRFDMSRRLGAVLSLAAAGLALAGGTVSPMIAKPVLPLAMGGLRKLLLRHHA